ncbi:hypothetical protein MHYP_G00113110 [Metynnis hypsauchen]
MDLPQGGTAQPGCKNTKPDALSRHLRGLTPQRNPIFLLLGSWPHSVGSWKLPSARPYSRSLILVVGPGKLYCTLRDMCTLQGTSVTAPRSPLPAAHPCASIVSHLPGLCHKPTSLQGQYGHPGPCGPLLQGMQFCGTAQASIHLPSSKETAELCFQHVLPPESNGQTEQVNLDLARTLRCQPTNLSSWAEYLPWAEYAHNTLWHSFLLPFECQFGFPPPMFTEEERVIGVPAAEQFVQHCQRAWWKACVSLLTTTEARKQVADRKRCLTTTFQLGQWVWLSTKDLRLHVGSKKAGTQVCEAL